MQEGLAEQEERLVTTCEQLIEGRERDWLTAFGRRVAVDIQFASMGDEEPNWDSISAETGHAMFGTSGIVRILEAVPVGSDTPLFST